MGLEGTNFYSRQSGNYGKEVERYQRLRLQLLKEAKKVMARPITTSIRFNGVTEITLTPVEAKDKELLGLAVRGNFVSTMKVGEDGEITFVLSAQEAPPTT